MAVLHSLFMAAKEEYDLVNHLNHYNGVCEAALEGLLVMPTEIVRKSPCINALLTTTLVIISEEKNIIL